MLNCLECTNRPAIFIKGVALCHTHAEQLIGLPGQKCPQAIGLSIKSLRSAGPEAEQRIIQAPLPAPRRIAVRAA